MSVPDEPAPLHRLHTHHPRQWRDFDYVYPVISRRSRGLSVGINLNVDQVCNFGCVYCQVDRSRPPARTDVDLDRLAGELDVMLGLLASGELWTDPHFAEVPDDWRRLNDIAFSGDGEPTACPVFEDACRPAVEIKHRHELHDVKLVVLTNATLLDRPAVRRGLDVLHEDRAEIWAKLDAGTEAYFKQVDRCAMPFDRVLGNLREAGIRWGVVIQTLLIEMHGEAMSESEMTAYVDRLAELVEAGGRIRQVQLHTIARPPTESWVGPVDNAMLEHVAEAVRSRLPGLDVAVFPGSTD